MKSLKIKNEYDTVANVGGPSNDGYFPSLSVSSKAIPELEDKEVGDECLLLVKVKITGINADNRGTRINLDVIEGEYDKEDSKDDADDESGEY